MEVEAPATASAPLGGASDRYPLGNVVAARTPGAVLALQRAAGNRATAAALRPTSAPAARALARCAGTCTCGGEEEEGIENLGRQMLRQATLARRGDSVPSAVTPTPTGLPQRGVARGVRRPGLADAPRTADGKVVLATIPISGSILRQAGSEDATPMSSSADAPAPATRASISSTVSDKSTSLPGIEVGERDARAIVADIVAAMSPHPGVTLLPFPSDLVAAADPPSAAPGADRTLATWPASRVLARSTDDKKAGFEGGFIGSMQLCYDFCKGEMSAIGWLWIGAGVSTKWWGREQWWGAYTFVEGPLMKPKQMGWKVDCGTCDPACGGREKEKGWEAGFGIGGFPLVIKPNQKVGVKDWGVELGVLFHPKSVCDGDVEFILLIDLIQYIPVYGPMIKTALGQVTKWGEKLGVHLECGGGIDISGNLHVCKSVPGGGVLGVTFDSALLCGGVYAGCNIGLSHNKSELPGAGKPG